MAEITKTVATLIQDLQAIEQIAERLEQQNKQQAARLFTPLPEDKIRALFDQLPNGVAGFCQQWGYRDFARLVERAHGIGVDDDEAEPE